MSMLRFLGTHILYVSTSISTYHRPDLTKAVENSWKFDKLYYRIGYFK